MSASELITRLQSAGIGLQIDGDNLRVNAPKGVMTEELYQALRENKSDLIRLLTAAEADDQNPFRAEEASLLSVQAVDPTPSDPDFYTWIVQAIDRRMDASHEFLSHLVMLSPSWKWSLMSGNSLIEHSSEITGHVNQAEVARMILEEVREKLSEVKIPSSAEWRFQLKLMKRSNISREVIITVGSQDAGLIG